METKKTIRKKITDIDLKLLELLESRAKLAIQLKKIKKSTQESIIDLDHETNIVNKVISQSKGIIEDESIAEFMHDIISICRALEYKPTVGYLGPELTFSHIAAIKKFGKETEYQPYKIIPDIFYAVESGDIDYGIVPIENSIYGTVFQTLDMFIKSNVNIVAEKYLKIELCLVSNVSNIKNIKKIYSHPQPLGQSQIWLSQNCSQAELIEVSSTSKAAELVKNEKNSAAISTQEAAQKHNLNVLVKNISDTKNNVTRFFIVTSGKRDINNKKAGNKTSLMFSIKDESGALYDVLKPFKDFLVNLSKIESRPNKQNIWEYIFFVDFAGNPRDENIKKMLSKVKKKSNYIKVLGTYRSDNSI